uniref:TNF receptor superfamily member 11a n=1 Tax=Varanus komodoensis TaxID=61221 RepID=A0A8D2L0Q8_VARKO
ASFLSLQITTPCISEQHYEYLGRCCTKCEPGKYMFAKCTTTSETVCHPCGPNEYMDVWNEEEKCLLHKICDHGKALIEVNPGNSTFQRQCACTAGYHWSEDCDCCRRNTKCPPGYGVKHPIQQNKNTECLKCPTGFFSNVSSATDACRDDIVYDAFKIDSNSITKWCQISICNSFVSLQDSPRDTFVNANMGSPAGLRLLEGTYLLDHDEYSFLGDLCCSHEHMLTRKAGSDTVHYGSGEDFPTMSLSVVSEDDHFRQMPMEDEYMDRMHQGPHYLPLLSQSESQPVSPFSEPLEVGENDSISQCFTGMESLVDLTSHCSCGMDHLQASSQKCLQNPSPYSGPSAIGNCGLDSLSVDHSGSGSNADTESDPSDGNDTKPQNAKRVSESNWSSSDFPAASGNVTGNGNSTFISSGQVMNFKGEIIVVYVSQNSQEGSVPPESGDDGLGSPVQEENLNRCETFAGNAHQFKEKCAEINSADSRDHEGPPSTV